MTKQENNRLIFGVEYMTTRNAAKILGVTPGSILRWVLNGEITGTKIGKNWFFTESNLKDFLAEKTRIGVARA